MNDDERKKYIRWGIVAAAFERRRHAGKTFAD